MERDIVILLLRFGLVAVVYFFLFQLLVLMWRDLHQPSAPEAADRQRAALEVLEAGASSYGTGDALPLDTVTSLGRGPNNAIVLADPSISGQHALVSFRLGQWWIEDQGSTNGTYINDMRIDQPSVLSAGDVVRLGSLRLRVRI